MPSPADDAADRLRQSYSLFVFQTPYAPAPPPAMGVRRPRKRPNKHAVLAPLILGHLAAKPGLTAYCLASKLKENPATVRGVLARMRRSGQLDPAKTRGQAGYYLSGQTPP